MFKKMLAGGDINEGSAGIRDVLCLTGRSEDKYQGREIDAAQKRSPFKACRNMLPGRGVQDIRYLVKAPAGAVFGQHIEFLLSVACFFGIVDGLIDALFLFRGREDALFGAADSLVGVHAFEKEFSGADGDLRRRVAVDLQGRELFKEALNLLEFGK